MDDFKVEELTCIDLERDRLMFEYSKENRILKNREFQTMYASSSKWVSTSFVVLGRITDSPIPRLGVVVSKKIGGAVTRNRIKRRVS